MRLSISSNNFIERNVSILTILNFLKRTNAIEVKDGKLIINPVKKVTDGDTGSTKEAASYTSGRVSTQNKQTFIYGRFECRAKVPKGHGYLPAFTLS